MVKQWIRKYLIKTFVAVYVVVTLGFFLLQLESNYRKNLVNYGIDYGENRFVTQIIEALGKKPCDIIQLEKDEQVIELVSKNCTKPLSS